ncbi:MAG: hypothetical protein OXM55_06870 [Bdellovibrionales bacterium]|nr:hypothetical protein [Bdellovibrionales bacterium]
MHPYRFQNNIKVKSKYVSHFLKYNKNGFLIIEIIIATGLFTILAIGSFKMIESQLLSVKTANNIQSEGDLRIAIHSALNEQLL